MRIDDENKVVWCSYELLNWHSRKVSRATAYYAVADAIDTYAGNQEFKDMFSGSKEFEMYLIAMLNHYTFKLEQPQKYYWRKKKEHLVWFEDRSYTYLNFDKFNEKVMITNATGLKNFTVLFTETEARDILKDDFDKFEKVECE